MMETGIVIYFATLLVLIWCASRRPRLHYFMISIDLLNRWTVNCQNLIVIDLRAKTIQQSYHETIPGAVERVH
jgi:hypothetical protein